MARLNKLHRSTNRSMIAGVMGGIAEYYGWSPTMLRLLFFIVSVASAAVPGALIYVILWLLMPKARPDSYDAPINAHGHREKTVN